MPKQRPRSVAEVTGSNLSPPILPSRCSLLNEDGRTAGYTPQRDSTRFMKRSAIPERAESVSGRAKLSGGAAGDSTSVVGPGQEKDGEAKDHSAHDTEEHGSRQPAGQGSEEHSQQQVRSTVDVRVSQAEGVSRAERAKALRAPIEPIPERLLLHDTTVPWTSRGETGYGG